MRRSPTTFVSDAASTATLLAALRELGFETGRASRLTCRVLDTIDGRLYRNGLRLVAASDGAVTISLSSLSAREPGEELAQTYGTMDALPVRASGLPEGALRDEVTAVCADRLLLAQATVSARRTAASWRRSSGELLSLVTVDAGFQLAGRRRPLASTVTVHRVAGRGKYRRRVEAVCDGLGYKALNGDVVEMVLAKAGLQPDGAPAAAQVELTESTPAIDGFRAVLAQLFVGVGGHWAGAAESRDPAFVHGLRVATRRSRSVLNEGATVLPREVLATAKAGLGRLGTFTGPARDLDVYLAEWDGYLALLQPETASALQPVEQLLEQHRDAAYAALAEGLASTPMQSFARDWNRWLRKPVPRRSLTRSADSERELAPFIKECIERAHSTLLENGRLITDASPSTQLHDLRRDAKRLRYLFECFAGVLPAKASKKFVRRLKVLQDNLGTHQDAEVHAVLLVALVTQPDARSLSTETLAAVEVLAEQLLQQCHLARAEFATRFAEYDSPDTQSALSRILTVAESADELATPPVPATQ